MAYFYHSERICMKTFLFFPCLQHNRFYSLVKHYRKNGLTLRVHGNAKRLPSSACCAETVEKVVKFIKNTAEDQALLLPGSVPGFKRIDIKLLPNGNTSGSNGYQKLDDLKLRFLATALRQKFDSPVFSEQWETVRARIDTKC